MPAETETAKRIVQARELLHQGKPARALKLLHGLDVPAAQNMRRKIETLSTTGAHRRPQALHNPILITATLGCLLLLLLFSSGLVLLMSGHPAAPVLLPTLIPTMTISPCTVDDVRMWWQHQQEILDHFLEVAAAASRTMPGAQLDGYLQTLQDGITALNSVPPNCTPSGMAIAYQTLLTSTRQLLQVVSHWRDGGYTLMEMAARYQENVTLVDRTYQSIVQLFTLLTGD